MTAYLQYRRLRALARYDRMANRIETAEVLEALAAQLAVAWALQRAI